jgi:competence protein ComEC
MPLWLLPTAALAMWVGILVVGLEPPRLAGSPLILVAVGCGVLASGRRRAKMSRSRRLVEDAGLLARVTEVDMRRRILGAAGLRTTSGTATGRPSGWTFVAVVAAAMLGGAGWAGIRAAMRPQLGPLAGRFAEFSGTAAGDVRRYDWGWGVEVAVERVAVDGAPRPVDMRLWVSGSGTGPRLQAGQPVSGRGTLVPVDPSSSRFDRYLLSRGVVATSSAARLRARGPPRNPAFRLAAATRDALGRGAARSLPSREAALLLGLAIGDTSRMDGEVEEDFRASGLAHLLAVSGSNVAMVLAPVLAVAGRLRLRLRWRVPVGLAAVGFFALVTRWEPSVLRATAMTAVALAGAWTGRPRATTTALGAAVIALLILDPWLAHSVGFQLSAAATGGLALLASPVASRLAWLPRPVALAASATVAAQVGTTPLLLHHFGVVPTVTMLANLLAFPSVGPALAGGLAAATGSALWEPLGRFVGGLAALPLGYLIGVADHMARLPLPSLAGAASAIVTAFGVLSVVVAWRLGRRRPSARAVAIGLSIVAVAWSTGPAAGPPASLTVTFLDVGQGDAAVVRTPEGGTVLIDAGPEPDQVAKELAALGVRRIDLAVATHAHADHLEGFPAVLSRFPVGLLLEPGCPADSPSYGRFLHAVEAEEIAVRHPRGGEVLSVGRLLVEVLGPDGCSPGGLSPNDDSVVLRFRYGDATALFPGDAEVPAQRDMLEDEDPVTAAVLKVPHHGGDTSDPEFFDAVDATAAVVSTGPNDYGHPHPAVLAALREEGMAVYRTDVLGDVTVRFSGGDLLVDSARR